MTGGSLRHYLTSYFSLITASVRVKIGLDIAKGMNYLHGWTPPILHRDLSTRNILLDVDGNWGNGGSAPSVRCKVADFGLSRLKLEHGVMTASVGCIPYMAPEVYKGEANSEKSDVYSYGMILWEVLTGEEPQQDMKPLKMAHMAAHLGYRPTIPMSTSPKWRQLIVSCWAEVPESRPTFRQIIGSLKEIEEDGLAPSQVLRSTGSSGQIQQSTLQSSNTSTPYSSQQIPTLNIPSPAPALINSPINAGEYTD